MKTNGSGCGSFNGLNLSMGNLATLSSARSRCISPENFSGEPGRAAATEPSDPPRRNVSNASREAGPGARGRKVNPYVYIASGETLTLHWKRHLI